LAEIAKDCHDLAIDAGNSIGTKDSSQAFVQTMLSKASAIDLLIDAINTPHGMTVFSEVSKFQDEEFDQVAISDGLEKGKPAAKNEVEIRFMVNLTDTCRQAIKIKFD
jgi:hypothetical protein